MLYEHNCCTKSICRILMIKGSFDVSIVSQRTGVDWIFSQGFDDR